MSLPMAIGMAIVMSMSQYSVAHARDNLPRLVDRALAGEEVVITRRGAVVAEIKAKRDIESFRDSVDRLEELSRTWPAVPGPTAVELLNDMYEEAERERGY